MDKQSPPILYVCVNHRSGTHSSCAARGSRRLLVAARDEIQARNMNVVVEPIVCLGECEKGPNMRFAGQEVLNRVSADDIGTILDSAPLPGPDDGAD